MYFDMSVQLLLAYINALRPEGLEVNRSVVENDAKALYKAGEKKFGTDEKTFIHIFSERSRAHLAAVSTTYHNIYDRELEKVYLLKEHRPLYIVMASAFTNVLLKILN